VPATVFRDFRALSGLTQGELAEALGVSEQTVYRRERAGGSEEARLALVGLGVVRGLDLRKVRTVLDLGTAGE
jgi:transcriptional regulator with XRE-family HTH domain